MPQLMTGRYYHQNILRAFRPDDQSRAHHPARRPWLAGHVIAE
jgi:hypothetical protein